MGLRLSARSAVWAGVVAVVVGTAACQRLDSGLTGGRGAQTSNGVGGTTGAGGQQETGTGGASGAADCPSLRTQAYAVLDTNCAICHEAPGTPSLYQGTFSFILDLATLTSSTSPQSSTTLTLKYVTKGRPNDSFIYQRITNNSMPPVGRTQRPSLADIQVLNKWITSCIDDPTSPQGWMASTSQVDAGARDTGPPLDRCGPANVCPNGACCVVGTCRPNGTTCGRLPNPIVGQDDLPGLSGTCNFGSCTNTAGSACGGVREQCCEAQTCTASQASCQAPDYSICSECGGTGQPCCKLSPCLAGHSCEGAGVGRVGTCELCGALGQPCCGSGVAGLRTCDGDGVCMMVSDTETRCMARGADGGHGSGD